MEATVTEIKSLQFSKIDVADTTEKKTLRIYNLRRAMALGNLYKRKVKIYFKALDGKIRQIETTVWAVCDDYISLKQGVSLPVRSIEEIEF